MEADALSTALMVMGEQDGMVFAEARGIAALFVLEDDGELRQSLAPAFSAMTE
jgi:thiamine biosynthesis lipoprotein